jgi:VWFA-related protein
MPRVTSAIAILSLAVLTASGAQDPVPPPVAQLSPPVLRITVLMIQVDAVVTDSAGKHVAGLRPEDFEILQDGVAQKLTYFSYEPGSPPSNFPETAPVPKSKSPAAKVPIGPPAPITASQVRRTVALVVDDLALSFEDLVRVREALRLYVERRMQPGDLVALVRTGGGVAILEQFTTDRRVLLEGVDFLKWRFSGRVGMIPIAPLSPGGAPDGERREPQILDYGHALSALGALGTIEQVVRGMKGLRGRKSIVFFSDGLRVDGEVRAALDKVTDMANRSMVSIYSVDPGGLRARVRERHEDVQIDDRASRTLDRFPTLPGEDDSDFGMQEGLDALAKRTGGLFYHDRNDIPECVGEASDDQLGYYLLGYSPREGTFEKDAAKAKFHRVTVRMRQPGLTVRWKSGFNGVPDQLTMTLPLAAPRTREQQLMDALASPFSATGLKVRLTSIYNHTQKTGAVVQSLLHFGGKELAFQHEADGTWHATVDVVTSAYRGVKQPMQQRQRRVEIRLSETQYQRALQEGFLLTLTDPMKLPGAFLMRAVVRDSLSERIGSASQFVQVPDTRKGQLAISGIFLKQAPPELVSPKVAEPSAAGKEGKVETWSEGGPAVRRYRPGQGIVYGYAVINPKRKGAAKEFQVGCQLRVFRNGKPFYTGTYGHIVSVSDPDPTRLLGVGVLSLGSSLSPGEYLMQIVVTDENAGPKKPPVAQWVDFEVVAARDSL